MRVAKVIGVLNIGSILHVWAKWTNPDSDHFPHVPSYGPQPNPSYMVDDQHNYFGTAPDKGLRDGPIWAYSGSFENYMQNLHDGYIVRGRQGPDRVPSTSPPSKPFSTVLENHTFPHSGNGMSSGYWLPELAPLGSQPLAGPGYKLYRNVVNDYGADNTGTFDATEAINAAIANGNRCGKDCGSSFTQGAIVYFPPGTYKICTPIIQYFYTQFIGDAISWPTIKGCSDFSGIALIDSDPYVPGGAGAQWYVNQNQVFRHIRNFIFDMNDMPLSSTVNDQTYVPTGIHWQASQATMLQNLVFNMPHASSATASTHVGILTENGSGGFVSGSWQGSLLPRALRLQSLADLTFNGGAIGWRAGSQQYTARNLTFFGCLTSVQMVWDWGFNWQAITIHGGTIGFNISGRGGDNGQGIGSVSIIDSTITDVPTGILTSSQVNGPTIILDNLYVNNVAQIVQQEGGTTLLNGTTGSQTVKLWGAGHRYNGSAGSYQVGDIESAPPRAVALLSGTDIYVRSRPSYESAGPARFLVATQNEISNDGSGDQANAINAFLLKARANRQIAFFPAGIYQIGSTVFIPTGSRVQGSSWSQIQGAGFYFSDMRNPQVMVQVGNKGDVGELEIVEMLFTVKGPTAGAILMEWNVQAQSQGSAAMWDSHFRVGGGNGTDLDTSTCPRHAFNEQCIAALLMLHVTKQSSGYFENVWAWVADHDADMPLHGSADKQVNQISVYGARGILIESQGPSWFYGTSSEHSVVYNYQISQATNIYIGHAQAETPYYQPNPVAPAPFDWATVRFADDPSFAHCTTDKCKQAWGLRVVDSTNITIHGLGLYSFFSNYSEDCVNTGDCQDKILEVVGSASVVVFNSFTVATVQAANGANDSIVYRNHTQSGFTTEVSLWLPLQGQDSLSPVYVGPEIWSNSTVACLPPCVLVIPNSTLSSLTTIIPGNYTTSFEYGAIEPVTTYSNSQVMSSFVKSTTTVAISIPAITTSVIPFYNYNVTDTPSGGTLTAYPSVPIPPVSIPLPDGITGTTTRTVQLPPWPAVTNDLQEEWTTSAVSFSPASGTTGSQTYYFPYITTLTITAPTTTTIQLPTAIGGTTILCPPYCQITFTQPETTLSLWWPTPTSFTIQFTCPLSKTLTFLASTTDIVLTEQCSLTTLFPGPPPTGSSSSSSSSTVMLPTWTTWPPGLVVPVTTKVDKPEPTDDGVKASCHLWFFFICIDAVIGGWHLILPPGIYPPLAAYVFGVLRHTFGGHLHGKSMEYCLRGLRSPSTLSMVLKLKQYRIGPDHQITYDQEPTNSCVTQTALVCSTTTLITESITGTTTTTETTISTGRCETVEGCSVTDSETATATTTVVACMPTASNDQLNVCKNDAIIYPQNPGDVNEILALISAYSYVQIEGGGETAFIWVPALDQDVYDLLKVSTSIVYDVQYYELLNEALGSYGEIISASGNATRLSRNPQGDQAGLDLQGKVSKIGVRDEADLHRRMIKSDSTSLSRRAVAVLSNSFAFHPSPNSLPKNQAWRHDSSGSFNRSGTREPYQYWYDETAGWDNEINQGYTVFMLGEHWVYEKHPEWTEPGAQGTLEAISADHFNDPSLDPAEDEGHGSTVAAFVNGFKLGTCKRCHVAWFLVNDWHSYRTNRLTCETLAQLTKVYDYVIKRGLQSKAVIVMSFVWNTTIFTPAGLRAAKHIFDKLDALDVVLVASSGNRRQDLGWKITNYPAKFGDPNMNTNPYGQVQNLIVVGATDMYGTEARFSQGDDYLTTYSPGGDFGSVWVPNDPDSNEGPWVLNYGTSLSAPAVAGIAAYLRSLDSPFKEALKKPANVKKMIEFLAHRYQVQRLDNNGIEAIPQADMRPVAWNGQVQIVVNGVIESHSCLSDYDTISEWDTIGACDGINIDMTQMGPGESTGTCNTRARPVARDDGGKCPLQSDTGISAGVVITFTSGSTPSPTCSELSGCGGTICSGFYCDPSPTGIPPDYLDPKDPSNGQSVPTTVIEPDSTTSTSSVPTSAPTCDDQCKLDNGNPCSCSKGECDANSPSCCKDASCPNCECDENSCTPSSPSCCASGTCAWSWTGGGGGGPFQPPSIGLFASRAQRANESSSVVVYHIWSSTQKETPDSITILGFDGQVATACNQTAQWEASYSVIGASIYLQTMYANMSVYGDTCGYMAGVASYQEVWPGALIGSVSCTRWASLTCYRGDFKAVKPCASGFVAEELICRWS
ncbi:glycoside hydrolase family 55 protein [Xylariaceae sp. FL1272]|nr:glycoside hydrolase family 55 protein [Xylariaceae sp. FL1272]